jgi:NADH-quinone oxidoreductase subunit L
MLLGAMGKSAQAPLHVWLADAMEAPTTICALIHAATMVNAGVYLMARTYPIFNAVPGWADTVLIVGAFTAFITGTLALVEPDFKRVLAYSTVSQLGYMFAGVGAGSVMATQFHLVNHAIFKALLFLCAGMVIHHVGSRNMYEMGGGVGRQMKFTGTCYLIGTLALCGIPIFNGFWSKDLIIGAAAEGGHTVGLVLLVLAAILTVAYSFRAYFLVFCGERHGAHVHDPGNAAKIPLGILAVGAVTSWLAVGFISGRTEASGLDILALNVPELIHHIISGVAVVYSLIAVAIGLAIFYLVKDTGKAVEKSSPGLFALLRAGYGFDGFYLAVFHGVRAIGASAFEAIYKYVLEAGLNRGIAAFFVGAGKAGKALHPGDVSYNVIGVVTGLLLVIAVMFLAV